MRNFYKNNQMRMRVTKGLEREAMIGFKFINNLEALS